MSDTIAAVAEEAAIEADAGERRTLPKVQTVQDGKAAARRKRTTGAKLAPAEPAPEPAERGQVQRFMVVKGDRFPFPAEFTGRELLYVQESTGLRAGELDDAVGAGDVLALCALTAVAMQREGRDVDVGDLLDLRFGNPDDGIDFVEEDGRPPALAAEGTEARPSAATGDPS